MVVLASSTLSSLGEKQLGVLVTGSLVPFYFISSLRSSGLFRSILLLILLACIVTPNLPLSIPVRQLTPVSQCLWELSAVLIPIEVGMESFWELYSGSSPARKERRTRRAAKQAFSQVDVDPTENGSRLKSGMKASAVIMFTFQLVAICEQLRSVPYGLLGAASAIFIPLIVYFLPPILHYVYYQYLEKILVGLGIVQSSAPPLPPLPLELWEKIIDFALEVPEYFGSDCRPGELPEFLAHRRLRVGPLPPWDPYRQSVQLRCRLRLVSRTWNIVVGRQASHWYTLSNYLNDIPKASLLKNPRRVDFYPHHDGDYHLYKSKDPFGSQSPMQSSWIRPAVVAVKAGPYELFFEQSEMLFMFQRSLGTWGQVESLAYQSQSLVVGMVPRISAVFSSLGTLILEGTATSLNKDVVFSHLHTLELTTRLSDLADWSCPQLRHLSLRSGDFPAEYRATMVTDVIVPLHFNNLEGLMLHLQTVVMDSVFWTRFPKLQLLGCANFTLIDPPPPNHPIQYLYIGKDDIYLYSPERLSHLLGLLRGERGAKNRRILYICPPSLSARSSPHIDSWRRFYAESRREGVKWKPIRHRVDPEYTWVPLLAAESMIG
ncbi:hypothetical protein FRC14_001779, partial [Serendipita sp. 396]